MIFDLPPDWLTGSSLLLAWAALSWRRRTRLPSPSPSPDSLEALADAVVRTAETTFRACGPFKKRLALLTLRGLLQDRAWTPLAESELEEAVEQAVRRLRGEASNAL